MANRIFDQFRLSIEKKVVDLFVSVAFGAAGAPTLLNGKGIESVTQVATGEYDIVLDDFYYDLLQFEGSLLAAAAEDLDFQLKAVDLDTKTISIFTKSGATPTDPSDGSQAFLKLGLSNTGIK